MKTEMIEITETRELRFQDAPSKPEKGPYVCFTGVDGYWRMGMHRPVGWSAPMYNVARTFYAERLKELEEAKRPKWEVRELQGRDLSIIHQDRNFFRLHGREDVDALIVALCKFRFSGEA